MTKSRIFLFLFVVGTTVLLYMLPRYVVNNTADEVGGETTATSGGAAQGDQHDHEFEIPEALQAKISEFYDSFKNAENQEKRLIFADSLAKAYKSVGKLDSLAKYTEVKAIEIPSSEHFLETGDRYYEAFNFAVEPTKRNLMAQKSQEYYQRVLDEDATLLDVKAKLAMTYVTGSNPMQGIMMLREVLDQEPNNELAIYNLGMLAITSGQYERAIERFEKLSTLDPENPEAYFYHGYCLFELGRTTEAKPLFEKVLALGIDGELALASEDYLKRIN